VDLLRVQLHYYVLNCIIPFASDYIMQQW
jgi:hypothetical protein